MCRKKPCVFTHMHKFEAIKAFKIKHTIGDGSFSLTCKVVDIRNKLEAYLKSTSSFTVFKNIIEIHASSNPSP